MGNEQADSPDPLRSRNRGLVGKYGSRA